MPFAMCCSPKAAVSTSDEAGFVEEKDREGIWGMERVAAGAMVRRAEEEPLCIMMAVVVVKVVVTTTSRRRRGYQRRAVILTQTDVARAGLTLIIKVAIDNEANLEDFDAPLTRLTP